MSPPETVSPAVAMIVAVTSSTLSSLNMSLLKRTICSKESKEVGAQEWLLKDDGADGVKHGGARTSVKRQERERERERERI